MMSADLEAAADEVCASCGKAALDDVKLKKCACELVKYCSDECRDEHREQHDEDCQKRQAEFHDDKLFTQPDGSHLGECPLCFLPMPLDNKKSTFHPCCSKSNCDGCEYANYKSNTLTWLNCPFCRAQRGEEENKQIMKRIRANDPGALSHMGKKYYHEGNYESALEYLTKAAELGCLDAHCVLGYMYMNEEGVEKDEKKGVYHYEKAAIGGHHQARYNLGCYEGDNGNMERAVKHFIIDAKLGDDNSMKALWGHYSLGNITKEDLEATLRAHKAALDAMKSPERKAAEELQKRLAKQKQRTKS